MLLIVFIFTPMIISCVKDIKSTYSSNYVSRRRAYDEKLEVEFILVKIMKDGTMILKIDDEDSIFHGKFIECGCNSTNNFVGQRGTISIEEVKRYLDINNLKY